MESQVKMNSGYSRIRSRAERNVARISWYPSGHCQSQTGSMCELPTRWSVGRGPALFTVPGPSALGAGGRDPLEEVPLPEEEHDDHRQRHDDAGGHHELELALAAGLGVEPVHERLEAERQRVQRRVAHEDQRLHE